MKEILIFIKISYYLKIVINNEIKININLIVWWININLIPNESIGDKKMLMNLYNNK